MINSALAELNVSKMTLEGLEKEKKGAQLFVPIGGGSYVKAKLETKKSIVVGIGADVAIEKNLHDAKVELELRISELEKTGEALNQQFNCKQMWIIRKSLVEQFLAKWNVTNYILFDIKEYSENEVADSIFKALIKFRRIKHIYSNWGRQLS